MPWFQFTYNSIGYLTSSIIALAITAYLWGVIGKTKPVRYLIAYFTLLSIFCLSYGVWVSTYSPWAIYLPAVINLIVFAMSFFIQFAYHFPRNEHPRESKIIFAISAALSLFAYLNYLFRALGAKVVYDFNNNLFMSARENEALQLFSLVMLLEYLWIITILLRKTVTLSHAELGASAPQSRLSLKHLFAPVGKDARSVRSFALATLLPLLFSLSALLVSRQVISWETYQYIFTSGQVVCMLIYVVIYINNSPQPTTFMIKLVGISLATILVLLGTMGRIVSSLDGQAVEREHLRELKLALYAIRYSDSTIMPDSVFYVTARPPAAGAASAADRLIFTKSGNFSLDAVVRSNLLGQKQVINEQTEQSQTNAAKDWHSRGYRYFDVRDTSTFYLYYEFLERGLLYEVGYSYDAYRSHMHTVTALLAYIVLGAVAVIFVVFPILFRASLTKPLQTLLRGVSEVNRGNLNVHVPVEVEDEIGILARSFNQMVQSIHKADQLKNELLEQTNQINTAYGRFVPHEFLHFLGYDSIVDVRLGDQVQKEMAVLFSDIRSFTTLSENMTPRENFNFINAYLGRMNPIIRKHNGFIDKYIGDAIMALFPKSTDDAVLSAIEMQRELEEYNLHRERRELQRIRIGIGIHAGSLMLGTIGDDRRMNGTVISDAVNLAARLEGLTKTFGISIAISQHIQFSLSDPLQFCFRFLGAVRVKGKKESTAILEVFDADPPRMLELKLETKQDFEMGVFAYFNREFEEGKSHFVTVLQKNPTDQTAKIYLDRCDRYLHRRRLKKIA